MKKYNFFTLFTVLLCLLFVLSGCRDSEPVKLVKSELSQIQKLDEHTIQTFISYKNMIPSGSDSQTDSDAAEAIQLFFQNFDYRILSSSITEENATVNVEIENIDAKALAKDLCLELIARSTSPNPEDSPLSTTGSYFSLLYDILSSGTYESVKTTAHFHLTETDDVWHIQSDESLENEIVGGFISYLRNPYLVTPEEITAKVFEMMQKQTAEDWVFYLGMNDIFSTYSTLAKKVDLALASQISKCFSYKIQKVTEKNKKATAVIDITSLDMNHVLEVYMDKLLDYASTTEAVRATDTELADKTAALLAECLNSNTKTCTKTIEIDFVNNGTAWEMNLNSDFTDALLGNMADAVKTFQSQAVPTS